jgi:hypothetical protein
MPSVRVRTLTGRMNGLCHPPSSRVQPAKPRLDQVDLRTFAGRRTCAARVRPCDRWRFGAHIPLALDLPGPSRRIVVEPLKLPAPAPESPREPADSPPSEPAPRPTPADEPLPA